MRQIGRYLVESFTCEWVKIDHIIMILSYGTLLPVISRLITFEDKIVRDKGFDCIFYCAFGAISSGIEKASYNLFLLKRGLNINCISQIISTLHSTIDSLQKVIFCGPVSCWYPIVDLKKLIKNFTKSKVKNVFLCESSGYWWRNVFE